VSSEISSCRTHDLCIHGLGEDLHRENVVVAVYDEPRQEIGFAEDHAVGIGVADERFAIGDGIGDALTKQRRKIGYDWLARDAVGSRSGKSWNKARCQRICPR
jgi:hypothetical protein